MKLTSYKRSMHIFQAARGRLLVNSNRDGKIGGGSGEIYTTNSFPAPYNTKIANEYSAPFIDLYLEKINDFRHDPDSIGSFTAGKSLPYSKVFKSEQHKGYFYFINPSFEYSDNHYQASSKKDKPNLYFYDNSNQKYKAPKIWKQVDEKIDDGDSINGNLSSYCIANGRYHKTYDVAIADDKGFCEYFQYNIMH